MFLLTHSKGGLGTFLNTNTGASFRCKVERRTNQDGSEILTIVSTEQKPAQNTAPAQPAPAEQRESNGKSRYSTRRDYAGRTRVSDDVRAKILLFKAKEKLTWEQFASLVGVAEHFLHSAAYTTNYQMPDEFYNRLVQTISTLNGDN